jgi:hypothetical protein
VWACVACGQCRTLQRCIELTCGWTCLCTIAALTMISPQDHARKTTHLGHILKVKEGLVFELQPIDVGMAMQLTPPTPDPRICAHNNNNPPSLTITVCTCP